MIADVGIFNKFKSPIQQIYIQQGVKSFSKIILSLFNSQYTSWNQTWTWYCQALNLLLFLGRSISTYTREIPHTRTKSEDKSQLVHLWTEVDITLYRLLNNKSYICKIRSFISQCRWWFLQYIKLLSGENGNLTILLYSHMTVDRATCHLLLLSHKIYGVLQVCVDPKIRPVTKNTAGIIECK